MKPTLALLSKIIVIFLVMFSWSQPGFSQFNPKGRSIGYSGTGSNIDVKYHRMNWRINPDSTINAIGGSVTTYFTTTQSNVTAIRFDLNNVFTVSATYHGSARSVTRPLTNIIELSVPNIAVSGTLDSVTIFYNGTPPAVNDQQQGYQRQSVAGSNMIFTLSETYEDRDWWPCKADMQDKIDSIDFVISTPSNFKAVANGVLKSSVTAGSSTVYTIKHRYPIASYLVAVSVAQYTVFNRGTVNIGGTNMPVEYYISTGRGASTTQITAMDFCKQELVAFGSKFGDYPFKNEKYGMYEFGWGGGMEHQTFSAMGYGVMSDWGVIAHELGHQWFGDKVTFATWNHLWLAEGFASYCEALAAELIPALGQSASTQRSSFKTTANNATNRTYSCYIPNATIANSNILWNSNYGTTVYARGAMVVSMLRILLGDDKFFQACRNYLNDPLLAYNSATSEDLKRHMQAAAGGYDLTPFFDSWVYGNGYPSYSSGNTIEWYPLNTTQININVSGQTKSLGSDVPYYYTPIPLRVQGAGGKDTVIVVYDQNGQISKAGDGIASPVSNNVVFDLGFTATSVTFDPYNMGLATGAAPLKLAPTPTASISGSDSVCKNAVSPKVTFTGAWGTAPYTFKYKINGGTTKTISTPASANSVDVPQPTTTLGTFVYTLVSVKTGVSTYPQSGTATIVVTTIPAAPSVISGPVSACGGSSQPYSVVDVAGVTYTWNTPVGWTLTSGQGTNAVTYVTGSSGGTISVTPSNSCGSGTAASLVVGTNTTLYWGGIGTTMTGGTTDMDFNTASNWSTNASTFTAAGVSPTSCNDVVMNIGLNASTSAAPITFSSTNTAFKNLTTNLTDLGGTGTIYSFSLTLADNQTVTVLGTSSITTKNVNNTRTTQTEINVNGVNSMWTYTGDITANSTNAGNPATSEADNYIFSNAVGTSNKGKMVIKGNATLNGMGDDSSPEINKPALLVFDGIGTQTISNNNSTSYPVYLGFDTQIGELNTPTVILKGSGTTGFQVIKNLTISNGCTLDINAGQFINATVTTLGNVGGTFTMGANSNLIIRGIAGGQTGSNFPLGFTAISLDPSSTVEYNGTSAQTVYGPLSYGNLKISTGGTKILASNIIVNSLLTLNSGILNVGTFNLTLAGNLPIAGSPFSSTNMIVADGGGEVRKSYASIGSFLFPIGDVTSTTEYSPITLNYTTGTFAGGAYSGVKVTNAKHPNNASSTNFLKRYWTVSNSGITSPSFTASGKYLSADIVGTESTVAGAKYTGSLPWLKYSVIGSNTLTTTAITNTGAGIIISGITNKVPVGTISGGGVSVCLGNSVSLSSSVTNNGTGSISYAWSPATELSSTSIANPVSTPTINRTYYLIVTDGNGITSTGDNSTLSVTTPPSASVAYNGAPFCYNSGTTPITFSGSTGGTYSGPAGLSINASTGLVNLAASTPGSYTVAYNIAAAGGCPLYATTAPIKINPNTWTGGSSSDWNTGTNWAAAYESGCPDITILAGLYEPILNSGTKTMQNLIIKPGASLILTNTAKLQVSGSITNSGIFDVSDGTLELTGTSAQNLAVDSFINNAVKHLIISNSSVAGVSLIRPLDIYGSLTFTGTGKKFSTNDTLTLKSNAINTAWVGDMTGNSIVGKVTVERFNSQHKAWRFLSIPTNTNQTIKQAWQEGGIGNVDNPVPGFGAQLTGPGGLTKGFDLYTATPSMKYYDTATGGWIGVANTDSLTIKNAEGYMVFIRGNRTSNAYNAPVTESVLRTKGTLYTGAVGPISVKPDKMASIGNPYASPIDFTKITKTNGIDDQFYLWDPFIPGSYNVGGYQTFSATNNWEPVPGGSTMYATGEPNTTIQSGQAFFVHATKIIAFLPVNYEVTFGESSKIDGDSLSSFSRVRGGAKTKSTRQFFRVSLFTGPLATDKIADGNAVAFGESYNNDIDGHDALKIQAGGENFDVKRSSKLLAVDARSSITDGDTIYYNMSKLVAKTYQLRFAPVNLGAERMEAFLVDKYLNKETRVSLTDSSFINITVSNDAGSKAADRFKVVFKTMTVLPVTIASVQAKEEAENIAVIWKVENETNMGHYEIEKSTNGISFIKTGDMPARNLKAGEYKWMDLNKINGYNYYRLRSVDMNGKTSLTEVVKVLIGMSAKASISVSPNPVVNSVINLQLNNQETGAYNVRILNPLGQTLMTRKINYEAGDAVSEQFKLAETAASGIYVVEVTSPSNEKVSIKVAN